MKKYLLLVILVGILIITPVPAWWNTDWTYRQEHTILGQNSDNANNSVLNEQIYLQVYNTSGSSTGDTIYIENHASLINMTDIRIVSTDDTTKLYHWINATFDDHIDLWFRPQEIVKDQGNPIYIYYGNPNTNDASDGYTTFLLYDHFEGSSINATQWNSGASNVISGSTITITGAGAWTSRYIYSVLTFPKNSSMVISEDSTASGDSVIGFADTSAGSGAGSENIVSFDEWGQHNIYSVKAGVYGVVPTGEPFGNDIVDIFRNNTFETFGINVFPNTWEYVYADSARIPDTISIPAGIIVNSGHIHSDFILVRHCLYPTTTHGAWGAEESGAVAPVAAFSCAPTSGTVPIDVTCTDASTNTPTSWSWNVENQTDTGFKTSAVQNPTFSFSIGGSGTFNVNMSATNAGGTDWENKTAYIILTEPSAPTPTPSEICALINTNITIEKGETWIKWNWSYTENISGIIIDDQDIYLNGTLWKQNYSHNYFNLPNIGSNSYQVLEIWGKNLTYSNITQCIYSSVRSDPSAVWWPFIIGMVLLCIGYFVPLFGFLAIIILLFGFYMVYQEYTQSYIVLTYGLSVVIAMFVTAFRIGRKK